MDAKTEMNSGVYCIRNKRNNKRYAGSSANLKNRWRQHKNKLRRGCHDNSHLQAAWDKYGENAFEFTIIAYMDADKALVFEDYLLKNFPNMFEYNIARDATAPMRGREHSEESKQKMREKVVSDETRAKMSESHMGDSNYWFGKTHSEESKQKISDGNRGKIVSDETRAKISKAGSGHLVSDETRKKMSESLSGENHPLFGKHHTEEAKQKMSESHSGDKNPRWIDISDEEIIKMKSLRNDGYTYEKIAEIFNISLGTVRNRLNAISSATPMKQEVGNYDGI